MTVPRLKRRHPLAKAPVELPVASRAWRRNREHPMPVSSGARSKAASLSGLAREGSGSTSSKPDIAASPGQRVFDERPCSWVPRAASVTATTTGVRARDRTRLAGPKEDIRKSPTVGPVRTKAPPHADEMANGRGEIVLGFRKVRPKLRAAASAQATISEASVEPAWGQLSVIQPSLAAARQSRANGHPWRNRLIPRRCVIRPHLF